MQSRENNLPSGTKLRKMEAPVEVSDQYFIPPTLILRGLGIGEADLYKRTAPVNMEFLHKIICEIARNQFFDQRFYANRYPDIEGARLAGIIKSIHDHFVSTGYLEGRLPRNLPFDAKWYYNHYKDLAGSFQPNDTEALQKHFLDTGCLEGRAGTEATLADAERWHAP